MSNRQWILARQEGFEKSLEFQENLPIPGERDLKPNDVLVKVQAASLNFRELQIAQHNGMNGPVKTPVVPACDGSGIVVAVGSEVKEFKKGDRVITFISPRLATSKGDDAPCNLSDALQSLGQGDDGTLRSYGVFAEKGLVHAPKTLDPIAASTLPCTWLTAYNVFFGLLGKVITEDSWVLIQGTGGVSVASLQMAVALGARVVATTSSDEKAAKLKALGALHVINYRTNANWGEESRQLTPEARGFDFVIDVGGDATLPQSLAAIRTEGVISLIGFVGGQADAVPILSVLRHTFIARGFLGGTRNQLKAAVRLIDREAIKVAHDDVVFELPEAKEAYKRLQEQKHFAKVVIRVDEV